MTKSVKKVLQAFIKELHVTARENGDAQSANRLAQVSQRLKQPDVTIGETPEDFHNLGKFVRLTVSELPDYLFRPTEVQKELANLLIKQQNVAKRSR